MSFTRTETATYGSVQAPAGTVPTSIVTTYTAPDGTTTVVKDSVAPVTPAPVGGVQGPAKQVFTPATLTVLGAYTASAQVLDQNGAPIGAPILDTFTLAPFVAISVPVSMVGVTTSSGTGTGTATVVPTAPVNPTAVAGPADVVVSFTPGTADTTNTATSFVVTASPGGATASGAASPITVPGLTVGTAYTFTVAGVNNVGTGAASVASGPATPVASTTAVIPDAPTIGTASDGPTSANVSFTAPVNNGGSAILDYTVTSTPGGIVAKGTVSPILVPGLTTGTPYTFTVTARNAVGISPASAASNTITPSAAGGGGAVAGAPTIGVATSGPASANVSFSPPASVGSGPVLDYTVTATPGGAAAVGTVSPLMIIGLTPGTAYTFTVTARNAAGMSAASAASNAVTPT